MAVLAHLNFRDLGGLAVGVSKIRRRVMFRSEGSANFSVRQREQIIGSKKLTKRDLIFS